MKNIVKLFIIILTSCAYTSNIVTSPPEKPIQAPTKGTDTITITKTPITITTTNKFAFTSTFTREYTSSPTITSKYSYTRTDRVKLIYYFDRNGPYGDDIEDNLEWSYLDLDSLTIGKSPESDLHFTTSLGSMLWYWLQAINGAKEWTKGKNEIGIKDCNNKSIPNEEFESRTYEGNHMCVISNKSKLYLIVIDRLNAQFPVEPHSYGTIYMYITSYI
jgi:hypothetical protein